MATNLVGYDSMRVFFNGLEKRLNVKYTNAFAKLRIYEYSINGVSYTRTRWESKDGWFIETSTNIPRRQKYTEKYFTKLCYDIYYNVLDTFLDAVKHWCEVQSNDTDSMDIVIKEALNGRG